MSRFGFMCPRCHIELDEDIFDSYECPRCGYTTSFIEEMVKEREKEEREKERENELRELERLRRKYPDC